MKGNTFQYRLHEEKLFSPFERLCTHKTNCLSTLREFVSFRIDFLWVVSYILWIIRKFIFSWFYTKDVNNYLSEVNNSQTLPVISRERNSNKEYWDSLSVVLSPTGRWEVQKTLIEIYYCNVIIDLWILKHKPDRIVFITVHTGILPIIRHAPTASRMVKISEGKPECACVNIRFPAIPPT